MIAAEYGKIKDLKSGATLLPGKKDIEHSHEIIFR